MSTITIPAGLLVPLLEMAGDALAQNDTPGWCRDCRPGPCADHKDMLARAEMHRQTVRQLTSATQAGAA
jgi:hypothetical protein